MSSYSITLVGPAPWGFRLQGGKDFCLPLTISRLTDGGKAALARVSVGDVVLSIDGISTSSMNHLEAQNKIKACAGNLNLTLQRAHSVTKTDGVSKAEPQEIIKPVPIPHPGPPTSFASPSHQPSPAYNKTARPFGGVSGVTTPSLASPKVASIPSASSAFTPAAPSQHAQPPFPLSSLSRSTAPAPASAPAPGSASSRAPAPSNTAPAFKTGSGRSAFTSPSSSSSSPSSSSSSSSSPARVTAPPSNPNVPQPSVYNTPINLYSNANACEVVVGQRRGLLESPGVVQQHNGLSRKPGLEVDQEVTQGPAASDASKKRVIEDTEDWHPRTGTSQSRSFRILAQITGTEKEQDQENNGGKNAVEDSAPPSAHVTPSAHTFTKAPPGAPRNGTGVPPTSLKTPAAQAKPSWQAGGPAAPSKGGATPSFGRVSHASLPKGPDRPVPQPHPHDLDTLVQRAEHIPAGTRTPMCGACSTVIRGPFLVAMGMSWHPEEFNCGHCHASLVERGFVEERGAVYCAHCYEQFLAPSCKRCQQKILGEVINALKQTWHVYCFLCASCQQPIRNNTFHLEDGQPYCEKDYYSLFGTSCHGCDFPIEAGDKFLNALGATWHDTCFVCAVCNTSLEGQAFFSKKDKPLCRKHAHTVNV